MEDAEAEGAGVRRTLAAVEVVVAVEVVEEVVVGVVADGTCTVTLELVVATRGFGWPLLCVDALLAGGTRLDTLLRFLASRADSSSLCSLR